MLALGFLFWFAITLSHELAHCVENYATPKTRGPDSVIKYHPYAYRGDIAPTLEEALIPRLKQEAGESWERSIFGDRLLPANFSLNDRWLPTTGEACLGEDFWWIGTREDSPVALSFLNNIERNDYRLTSNTHGYEITLMPFQ
ncbi:hypothetical protein BDV96DRAFT_604678 [Lophiotrema nucula]|uniref:Uncharacterized protein n=1 Tax=Lophiotrema nucula TaxID=690887 RepID=A0A6A5YQF3_9PLEO|nr:hypothetical protein BDV96DRAFT_604678 [Lophiotrema nucula]